MNNDIQRQTVMVSICCIVYNQEPYIRRCLDGFVMQKANFHFEAIVHDDASTDGSADIIREYAEKYPDIIKPIFEAENQYSKRDGSLRRIMDAHMCGKYIAYCEGDDYWIDPLKLQKQVDYMEKHANCSLVYSKNLCYDQEKQKVLYVYGKQRSSLSERLIGECFVGTCTTLLRRKDYLDYLKEINPSSHNWLMGDIPLWLYLGTKGVGYMFNECFATYRILQTSASHSPNIDLSIKRIRNTCDIYLFFAEKYGLKTPVVISKWEGGYWFRVYNTYKELNIKLPDDVKKSILNYHGNHFKLYVTKIELRFPWLGKVINFLKRIRMIFLIKTSR